MVQEKKLCEVHHLYYKGSNCPICEEERIYNLAKKYPNSQNCKTKESRDVTKDDILKLIQKFNNR